MGWRAFTVADELRDTTERLNVARAADGSARVGDSITLANGDARFKLSLLGVIDPAPVESRMDDLFEELAAGRPGVVRPMTERRFVGVRLRVRNVVDDTEKHAVQVIHSLRSQLIDDRGDAHGSLLGGVDGCPMLLTLPQRGEPSLVGCLAFRIPAEARPYRLMLTINTTVDFDDPLYTVEAASWNLCGDQTEPWRSDDQDVRAQLISRLADGPEIWNAWRSQQADTLLDLDGADLRGLKLAGVDLSRANVSETNFAGADLTSARFTYAYAKRAVFAHARLDNAEFRDAVLEEASFFEAAAVAASFRDADLTKANLDRLNALNANFEGATLYSADLTQATIASCQLQRADLRSAVMRETVAMEADLSGADLRSAELVGAYLAGIAAPEANLGSASLVAATLTGADMTGASLHAADLRQANLVGATLDAATLDEARVYGASVWSIKGVPASSKGLVITTEGEPTITVDDLQIAQFVHLLIANVAVRDVVDTITAKTVLILGRFTEPRKRVLDALRDALRCRNLVPIIFDFDAPHNRDVTETVGLLARMARFILADLTDPASVPHELASIVRDLPSVPVQPLILAGERPYAMFRDLQRYPWVLAIHEYQQTDTLVEGLGYLLAEVELRRSELGADRG